MPFHLTKDLLQYLFLLNKQTNKKSRGLLLLQKKAKSSEHSVFALQLGTIEERAL